MYQNNQSKIEDNSLYTSSSLQQQQKFTTADVTCTILQVRNEPFAIPSALIHLPEKQGFGVKCEVADSAAGTVSVLVTKTPPTDIHQQQQLLEQQQQRQQLQGNNFNGSSTAAVSFETSTMIIQRIPLRGQGQGNNIGNNNKNTSYGSGNSIFASADDNNNNSTSSNFDSSGNNSNSIVAWRLARYLRLASLIHPQLCPNVLPLIAAYRHRHRSNVNVTSSPSPSSSSSSFGGNEAVYLCQPHIEETLASAARAAPTTIVQPNQIRTILRELLDALSLLHKNNVVVADLNPTTIRVNAALRSRSDVALCLSRPVLGGTPMLSRHFIQLVDLPKYGHRYLAPEVACQIVNASASKANVTPDPGSVFSMPDKTTVVVSTAADIWSLGCVLAELALGRPLFPSENIFEHSKVVSNILSVPFPELNVVTNQFIPLMIAQAQKLMAATMQNNNNNTGNDLLNTTLGGTTSKLNETFTSPSSLGNTTTVRGGAGAATTTTTSSSNRIGMFSGIQASSYLQTALASTEPTFRQLIASMLQMDPSLRPSAEDLIRSPFVSLGTISTRSASSGGGSGGGQLNNNNNNRFGGGAGATTRNFGGGRRNSGTSSGAGSIPQQQQYHQGRGNSNNINKSLNSAIRNSSQQHGGSADINTNNNLNARGAGGLVFDFGIDWAIPTPFETNGDAREIMKEIQEGAPEMP